MTRCCEQVGAAVQFSLQYLNYPKKIYTSGAGEGGGFLKAHCTAKANAAQVFEGSLATDTAGTNQPHPIDNDVIMDR